MAYISWVHVENCRNVQDLTIDLAVPAEGDGAESSEQPRAPFQHLILTGRNGSGKSGVLKSVAACLRENLFPHGVRSETGAGQSIQSIWDLDGDDENLGKIELGWQISEVASATLVESSCRS